jgi:hypothetical protein
MLNQLFGDFLGFVTLFSHYLDAEWLFHFKLTARKTFMVSFASKSPEAQASLWNLMVCFDGFSAWPIPTTHLSANAILQNEPLKPFWTPPTTLHFCSTIHRSNCVHFRG